MKLTLGRPWSVLALVIAAARMGSAAGAQDCSVRPLGQLPIDDLHEGDYLGVEGGLYPGRSNTCPDEHLHAGKVRSKAIEPLDRDGRPADDGVIGFASVGMSLTGQVFTSFRGLASADADLAPALALPDFSGNLVDLERLRDPTDLFWTDVVPEVLEQAGLSVRQIQAIWMMDAFLFQELPFPDHIDEGADAWVEVLQLLQTTFPNLKVCFLTPLYAHHYTSGAPEREPYYFEQGFAVREVIARQLAGDPELNWNAQDGEVRAPWIDWGPYFWSDGEEPRTDGLAIACADIGFDGVHLSDSGKEKLGMRLLQFVKSHRACTRWSVVKGTTPSERLSDVERIGRGTRGVRGEPRLCGGSLPTLPHADPYQLLARGTVRRGDGFVLLGDSLLPGGGVPFAGGTLYVDIDLVLPITFDPSGNGVLELEPIPDDPALIGASYYAQLVANDTRGSDGTFALSAAIELRLGDGSL